MKRKTVVVNKKEYLIMNQHSIQSKNCHETARNLNKCIECYEDQETKSEICRFSNFRKLKIDEHDESKLKVAGFLNPKKDNKKSDAGAGIWSEKDLPKKFSQNIDSISAQYILKFVSHIFCKLVLVEEKTIQGYNEKILWRKQIEKTRETCDVCR